MEDQLNIALCALDIVWQNPEENFKKIKILTENLNTDIIVLPEMFSMGFTTNPKEMAEASNGPSAMFMQQLAKNLCAVICGSIPTIEDGHFYNRFYWVEPSGIIKTYDKRHLFSFDNEHDVYSAGKTKVIIDYLGWKICPLVCYDLRFPVWSRNTEASDLYIYVAHWPEVREDAWRTLLKARAIENLSYVAGVNRSGDDPKGLHYSGFSAVFNPIGKQIESNTINEFVKVLTISKTELDQSRKKFPFLNDRDSFTISI